MAMQIVIVVVVALVFLARLASALYDRPSRPDGTDT